MGMQAEEMGMLDPLDTQEVETLEEKEADPLDNLLEGILPNTGPLSDTDDFMLDILPDQVDGEQVSLKLETLSPTVTWDDPQRSCRDHA